MPRRPASISGLILKDSAKIQTNDIERTNRKRALHGEPPLAPIYGAADVDAVLKLLRPLPYGGEFKVAPNISVQMVEAGHILGSASIGVMLDHPTGRRTVVFSGDIGPKGAPVLRDAQCFVKADVVFLESTYGDRDHRPLNETVEEFRTIAVRHIFSLPDQSGRDFPLTGSQSVPVRRQSRHRVRRVGYGAARRIGLLYCRGFDLPPQQGRRGGAQNCAHTTITPALTSSSPVSSLRVIRSLNSRRDTT